MTTTIPLYDIVIVGAGPVGLMLATCLARWGYSIKHVDNRESPTLTGRADGIQPRSLDILRNMGLKRQIMSLEPAVVREVAFWEPLPGEKGIHRTGHWTGCPSFIDTRYPFSTLLHQGHIERIFIEDLEKNGSYVQRPWTITDFKNTGEKTEHPVEIRLKHTERDEEQIVRSKYLFSGEGARSFIRDRLGVKLTYKSEVSYVWGVIDGVIRTDFPDVRLKCTIHSDHGSIMVIPREQNMVRLYIQIASSSDPDFNPHKRATAHEVQVAAKKILQPYYIEWDRVEWYSSYPIRQAIAEKYTLDHRVFLGGDCCHTHSPKAGQGMNAAFHDALNLAWKIHHVESGFADRSVLYSYESERKAIAEELIDFDAKFSALFSQRLPPTAEEIDAASHEQRDQEPNEFVKLYKASVEFTTGYGILYKPNAFNWSPSHPAQSGLFRSTTTSLRGGRVMPSANVTRVIDAGVVYLEQEIPLNGSFRIFLFAGNPNVTAKAVGDFAKHLTHERSFYSSYERTDKADVSAHERHNPHSHFFTFCITYAAAHRQIDMTTQVPPLLARYSYHIYADDIFEPKLPEAQAAAHAKMGLSEEKGGIIVVRPDGHVGCIVDLVEGSDTVDALNNYFGAFTSKPVGK